MRLLKINHAVASAIVLAVAACVPAKGEAQAFSSEFAKADVEKVARSVADWQIEHFGENPNAKNQKGWIPAAFYVGLFDLADLTGDEEYFKWLTRIGNRNYWQVADRMYHADDVCVAQMYLDMHKKYGKEAMMIPTQARIDWVIEHPSDGPMLLNYRDGKTLEHWSWCDALFMAPPVYARMYAITGDKKYMEFADKEFKATYDYLFDKDEHLFYRDGNYFDKKEKNGAKVFWGRGNGWVMGGLAEMLKSLPADDKEYRPFYEDLFKEMSERLAGLQCADGYWRASLLDPDSYPSPETSATGFITYALAYGINQGYLPADKYLPVVKKGWDALVKAVGPDGKEGYVQPVGQDPQKVTADMTELYGPGAFLLAACEVHSMSK